MAYLTAGDLSTKLQKIASGEVVPYSQYANDPDLALILKRGKDFTHADKFVRMGDGQCHWNVAKLFDAGKVDHIVIGYAHNFQGWHQHTWGLSNGKLVETTSENLDNDHWFGYVLSKEESTAFAKHCATNKPGGPLSKLLTGGIMKIEAKHRLLSADEPDLELRIFCKDPTTLKTLINLLGVIQHNGMVGHGALVGAFFDGDGAGQIRVEGLPEGIYNEMGNALSSYGDGHLAEVGSHNARAWNVCHPEGVEVEKPYRIVRPTQVWPEEG